MLANLPISTLLSRLAQGLELIAEHVLSLEGAAEEHLGRTANRAAAAIRLIAEEEAAKYLILLDTARCARGGIEVKLRQLKRCNDHVAKGVYAELVDMRPATFDELINYAADLRVSHYLDGPNDFDWMFRNRIEAKREERLYVDYVDMDSGAEWLSPSRYDGSGYQSAPSAVSLAYALHVAGASTEAGLSVVDDLWHDFIPMPTTNWIDVAALNRMTLDRLPGNPAVGDLTAEEAECIIDTWTFPLYGIEVERIAVDKQALRRLQASHSPGGGSGSAP